MRERCGGHILGTEGHFVVSGSPSNAPTEEEERRGRGGEAEEKRRWTSDQQTAGGSRILEEDGQTTGRKRKQLEFHPLTPASLEKVSQIPFHPPSAELLVGVGGETNSCSHL